MTNLLKEVVIKDNGAFGAWDYDALANEWDDLPLGDWGVPAWNTPAEEIDPSELFEETGEPLPKGEKIILLIPADLSALTDEIKESIRELFKTKNLDGIMIK